MMEFDIKIFLNLPAHFLTTDTTSFSCHLPLLHHYLPLPSFTSISASPAEDSGGESDLRRAGSGEANSRNQGVM